MVTEFNVLLRNRSNAHQVFDKIPQRVCVTVMLKVLEWSQAVKCVCWGCKTFNLRTCVIVLNSHV